jgi:hypothetical protein
MMAKIENLEQLQSEIKRLRVLTIQQEVLIKNDLMEIREDIKPRNIILNILSSITGVNINKKIFLKGGIAGGMSVLIQRLILKAEKKMENKMYDFVDGILDKVNSVVNKFSGSEARRSERRDD